MLYHDDEEFGGPTWIRTRNRRLEIYCDIPFTTEPIFEVITGLEPVILPFDRVRSPTRSMTYLLFNVITLHTPRRYCYILYICI